jgi:hypothetical protein
MASEDYAYGQVVIENADESPITIKQFVTQAHHHLDERGDITFHYRKNVGFSKPPLPGESVGPDFARGYRYYDPKILRSMTRFSNLHPVTANQQTAE